MSSREQDRGQPRKSAFQWCDRERLAAPMGQYTPFGSDTGGVFVAASNGSAHTGHHLHIPDKRWSGGWRALFTISGQQSRRSSRPGPSPWGRRRHSPGLQTTWTISLVPVGNGTRARPRSTRIAPAGNYSLYATYSGDANYNGSYAGQARLTVSAARRTRPADQTAGGRLCGCAGPVQNAVGGERCSAPSVSASGVNFRAVWSK